MFEDVVASGVGNTHSANNHPHVIRADNNSTVSPGTNAKVQPIPVSELANRLVAISRQLTRLTIDTANLTLDSGFIDISGRAFPLDSSTIELLSKFVGAPGPYLAALPMSLAESLLRYHANDLAERMPQMCVSVMNEAIIGIGRGDLCQLNGPEVLQAVQDGVGQDAASLVATNIRFNDGLLHLDLVSKEKAVDVRLGDVLWGGIEFEHSLVGDHPTRVLPYVHRPICSNGLTHRQCLRDNAARSVSRIRRLRADSSDAIERQADQIRRLVGDAWSRIKPLLETIQNTRSETIEVNQTLQQLLRRARLHTRALVALVQAAWEQEGSDPTAYGLLNALTRVATHNASLNYRTRTALSRLAGLFARRNVHLCPHCMSVLAA